MGNYKVSGGLKRDAGYNIFTRTTMGESFNNALSVFRIQPGLLALRGKVIDAILTVLVAFLILGYIGINFIARLPGFLIAENISLAIAYAVTLLLHLKGRGYIYTASLAWFNAGRVSRSIVEATGELAPLAYQHIPLLALILLIAILASLKAGIRV